MNRIQRIPRATQAVNVSTVIIGAGQAGLAMSRQLSKCCIDHVILERGDIANSWRRERWDSLKLLTPNWQSRLPGQGSDPNGFMSMPEVVQLMDDYANFIAAPVHTGVNVTEVTRSAKGYRIMTSRGLWQCRTLVIASGAFNVPNMPRVGELLPDSVVSLCSQQYRRPEQLPSGEVLVVGGSASGLQLAHEIQQSGRPVTLAVGEHVRLPRSYRGKDVFWWMDRSGIACEHQDDPDELRRSRNLPSPQLTGSADLDIFDLNHLTDCGVTLTGRLMGIQHQQFQFSGALANICKLADLKMARLLDRFDQWQLSQPPGDVTKPARRFAPTRIASSPLLQLSTKAIKTVIWATGYRPDYSWLKVPVLDSKGALIHTGGVVAAPGMYVIGLPFMRSRQSSFIYGAGEDAVALSRELELFLRYPNVREVSIRCAGRGKLRAGS